MSRCYTYSPTCAQGRHCLSYMESVNGNYMRYGDNNKAKAPINTCEAVSQRWYHQEEMWGLGAKLFFFVVMKIHNNTMFCQKHNNEELVRYIMRDRS